MSSFPLTSAAASFACLSANSFPLISLLYYNHDTPLLYHKHDTPLFTICVLVLYMYFLDDDTLGQDEFDGSPMDLGGKTRNVQNCVV